MARRYAIIGGGPGGLSAAEEIRRIDAQGQITMVSNEKHDFYSRPGLAYYLLGIIPEEQLYYRRDNPHRDLGLTLIHDEAAALDPGNHLVHLARQGSLKYDRLLIATGAGTVLPALPGIESTGVVTLDSLDDARRIIRLARRAKNAVVVGGGITALEIAEGLAARGVRTTYLLRKDRYWRNVLDQDESSMVEARLTEEGIQIYRNTSVQEIMQRSNRVHAARLADGREIRCDILAIAIGIRPRIDLAASAGLETSRGILTDEYFQSSAPDVYAAGDVAQVLDVSSGEHKLDSLWWVAVEQGRLSGMNMTGMQVAYRKGMPFNVTKVAGITTTIMGRVGMDEVDEDLVTIIRGDSDTWRESDDGLVVEADSEISHLRVIVGESCIEGAILMGDQELSRPLQGLIQNRADVSSIRERLREQPHQAAQLLMQAWREEMNGKA